MDMLKVVRRQDRDAFTLVELMIVVVIVAILAMVAIPIYMGNVTAAKMSEGISGCGTIRTALRVYAASHNGSYPTLDGVDGTGLSAINVNSADLDGKYFQAADYEVTSAAAAYTVTATLGDETYIINQDGVESGTFTTE
jgi:prepilin-type N-terminal cleavage/methylation domain-containing protein